MSSPNDYDDGLDRDPRQLREYAAPDAYTSLPNLRAYKYFGNGLHPTTVFLPDSWEDSATTWEFWHSTLIGTPRRTPFSPVVDSDMNVVGHVGWALGTEIYVPSGSSLGFGSLVEDINRHLREGETIYTGNDLLLRSLVPAPVVLSERDGTTYVLAKHEGTFKRLSTNEAKFFLLTRPDGQVLAALAYDSVGLESADDTFWTILGLGRIVLSIGRWGRRGILSLILKLRSAEDTSKIFLPNTGQVVFLGAVQDGKVVAHALSTGDLSHELFVLRKLGWKVGALPPRAWVITFGKEEGKILALLSKTFHGGARVAPPEVQEAVKRMFR